MLYGIKQEGLFLIKADVRIHMIPK